MAMLPPAGRRALLAAAVTGFAGTALAQAGRVTRLLVPVPPGGGMDACARLLAEFAPRDLIGTTIVENRPGGALRIAIEAVLRAEADGRTLLFAPASVFTIYPHIYRRLSYTMEDSFSPISTFCEFEIGLAVPGGSPITSLEQYLATVRREGGRMAVFGVPAAGSAAHFAGAQLAVLARVPLEHVPYRGSAPAMQDLMAGNLPALFNVASEFVPLRGTGRVTVLATSGPRRSTFMPDVPTFTELGYPDIIVSEWFGLFAPARTPAAVIEGLNTAVAGALMRPEVQARLATLGYTPSHMAAADFARRIVTEREGWGPVVRATGFTVEE